jgi:hypothetical protein
VLVVGVLGLPEVGLNLSERRASGFRWYVVTLQGSDLVHLRSVGSRSFITPRADGLHAMVAVGYARRGLTDPYEYRVELPDGALLDVEQYEFLMNALDSAFPIGVEINTFSVRRDRVDLDGDGRADPLPPSIFRTYRRFVHRRHAGEAAVTVTPEP